MSVSFLIDTGADVTTVPPEVIQRLQIDYTQFRNVFIASGIGGSENLFAEPAELFFHDADRGELYRYSTEVCILPLTAQYLTYPSLLGRDVINRWSMLCDPVNGALEIEIRTSDEAIKL